MNADGLYLVSYYALLLNLKLCCCGYYKRRTLTPVLSLVRASFVSSDQFSPVFKDKDSKIKSKTRVCFNATTSRSFKESSLCSIAYLKV